MTLNNILGDLDKLKSDHTPNSVKYYLDDELLEDIKSRIVVVRDSLE